ncbi:hypothetical protein C0J52_21243 [Blattella germanica]|nr:hypothetical protein C0J52_21243 [Blattella germanica]
MKCFSAKRNLRSLKPLSTQLDVLNSLKFFCISIIIISHRGASYGAGPLWNLEYLEREFTSSRLAILHRADLLVDSFFVISGLLMAYLLLKELPKQRINAIYLILIRVLRLTPGLSLMIFFYSTIFYKLGSGPRWDLVVGPERDCCRKNWWTNLLFINNYVDEQNMGQSIVLCWSMASIVSAVTMYGVVFYEAARPYNALEAGIFAGFHRFTWALGTATFILIIIFGKLRNRSGRRQWSLFLTLFEMANQSAIINLA